MTVRAHLAPGSYVLQILHRQDSLLFEDLAAPVQCSRFAFDMELFYVAPYRSPAPALAHSGSHGTAAHTQDAGSCDGDLLPRSLMGSGWVDPATGAMRVTERVRFDGEALSQASAFVVKDHRYLEMSIYLSSQTLTVFSLPYVCA